MLQPHRLRTFALLTLAASTLTACHSKPAPPADGLFHLVLQTDWYPQPEHGGFYEAQLDGLYKAQGLAVEILPGGPSIVAGQQIATNAAQFAMGSSDSVLVDNAHGVPEVAVAATMQQDPQAVMVHADSPVHTFADLDNRTIAAKPGSIWLEYLIERYNLKNLRQVPATYSIANFVTDPNYIQQCFVTSEPYFAQKAGASVRTLLISSTDYQPYRVVFTSRQFLADHPEIVQKFVAASLEGWRRYLASPTQVDAQLTRLNPAMSPAQMQFSVDTLKSGHFVEGLNTPDSHLGHMTPTRWQTLYTQLIALKVLPHPLDPTTTYTTQFIP
jgi:NitT/TauT family transport system substrate-binding protein